jgi:polysaccharide export outer membrane protein
MRRSLVALATLATLLQGCQNPQATYYATPAVAPYRLGSGDRLRIIVFGQDTLSNAYDVDSSGNISMPLIGLTPAAGLTPARLQAEIAEKLRDGFLRDPHVSVEIAAYRPFFILGEVTTAGQYPYVSGMTVETAVAIAGGFTPRGLKSNAKLTRTVDGRVYQGVVAMSQPVLPGDTITIRERLF